MKRLAGCVCLLLCALSARALGIHVLSGHFSLQGGIPKTEGHLRLTPVAGDPLRENIDIWMTSPGSTQPIHDYAVEMTKRLHLVIVSSDFSTFLHVHPLLGPDGHFTLNQQFPAPGLYYLYADAEPDNLDHQVFRFDASVGRPSRAKTPVPSPTGDKVQAGPYTVRLSSVDLRAGGTTVLTVHIRRNGRPAGDLHPYLGALAHAVFLNSRDLSYVHVHPMPIGTMQMSGMSMEGPGLPDSAISSPDMMLHVEIHEPGTYKLWLQFRGGSHLWVAPFVLRAQ